MPSRLIPRNPNYFQQELERAKKSIQKETNHHRSPWAGYLPDMDPHNVPPNGAWRCEGLVARPDPSGRGEVLMPDYGFALSSAEDPITDLPLTPLNGNSTEAITMLYQFPRTNALGVQVGDYNLVPIAMTSGNNVNAGSCELWWQRPTAGPAWEEVPFNTNGAVLTAPVANREALPDVCIMPAGAGGRAAYLGPIDQPVAIITNGIDPVMVFPCDAVGGAGDDEFSYLTDQYAPFIAVTCEVFNGRVYYGNTTETGFQHRQRIRRTAPFTADPLVTNVGAGAFDVRDFSRDLLRLEKLGNVMAAYFEDGVAFIRPTGVATAPDAVQVLKEKRGLISTHAVVSVGDNAHFGIFDDGWFILDSSGRWTEIGLTEVDGKQVSKWKDTFYRILDVDNRHRLVVSYDGFYIRIAIPVRDTDSGDNEDVWIYDIRGDRVFTDKYEVTCWGLVDNQISAAMLWNSVLLIGPPATAWSAIIGSWADFGARFGLQALMHGRLDANIVTHDADLITRWDGADNVFPSYSYRSPMSSLGAPRLLKTATKLWVEYIHAESPVMTMKVSAGSYEGAEVAESGIVSLQPAGYEAGAVLTAFKTFNLTATNLQFQVNGTAPIMIRSFESDYIIHPWEERRG